MSDIELIDSHCHLIFENFDKDLKDVVSRYLVLLATGLEDRKHGLFLFSPRSVVPG